MNDFAVYLSADAAMAYVRMDTVGKVDGNSPLGQVDDVAPRRKDEDFVGEGVELEGVDEFLGIARILPFEEVAEPAIFSSNSFLPALALLPYTANGLRRRIRRCDAFPRSESGFLRAALSCR